MGLEPTWITSPEKGSERHREAEKVSFVSSHTNICVEVKVLFFFLIFYLRKQSIRIVKCPLQSYSFIHSTSTECLLGAKRDIDNPCPSKDLLVHLVCVPFSVVSVLCLKDGRYRCGGEQRGANKGVPGRGHSTCRHQGFKMPGHSASFGRRKGLLY